MLNKFFGGIKDIWFCTKYFAKFAWKHLPIYYLYILMSVIISTAGPFVSIIGSKYLINEIVYEQNRNMNMIIFWVAFICIGTYIHVVGNKFANEKQNYCNDQFDRMLHMEISSNTMKMKFEYTENSEMLDSINKAGRAFEQIRNSVGYPHLNVKIGATHAGISVGEDGATHQCNEDIALMRTIPGMTIINPSDDVEAKAAVRAAYELDGPVYLRFGRLAVPVINDNDDYKFEIGKGVVLREGKDVTIVATGLCVSSALEAADMLAEDGIEAKVINIHTIKPIDSDLLVEAAKETGKVVTVEEHSVIGGLGGAVCEVLSEKYPVPVKRIGVNDVYGESGPAVKLIEKYGLDGKGVYASVKEFVK